MLEPRDVPVLVRNLFDEIAAIPDLKTRARALEQVRVSMAHEYRSQVSLLTVALRKSGVKVQEVRTLLHLSNPVYERIVKGMGWSQVEIMRRPIKARDAYETAPPRPE